MKIYVFKRRRNNNSEIPKKIKKWDRSEGKCGNSDTIPKFPISEKDLECSVMLITKLLTQHAIGWGGGTRINSV